MAEKADRVAYRFEVVRREAPRTLLVAGSAFVLITIINFQVGPPMPVVVLVVNVLLGLALILGALVISHPRVPSEAAPWILAACAYLLMLVGQVELWADPNDVHFTYLVLILVIFPTLTLAWLPATCALVPMLIGCVVLANGRFGESGPDWIVVSISAAVVGMALLWLRLSTADELAGQSVLVSRMATRDRLTGALNRHGVEERIPDLLALATRHHEQVFALFADVDGLKSVNDTHGHAVGDAVLKAAADAIRETVRATDLVGRWGGDEFIVLGLGHIGPADELSERLRITMLDKVADPQRWAGELSVGVAVSAASAVDVDVDVEALIRRADADMYDRRRRRRAGA